MALNSPCSRDEEPLPSSSLLVLGCLHMELTPVCLTHGLPLLAKHLKVCVVWDVCWLKQDCAGRKHPSCREAERLGGCWAGGAEHGRISGSR